MLQSAATLNAAGAMVAFDLLRGHAGALPSEVLGSGYGHRDVLRAPSKHSTGPRASRAMTLVRLGDPGDPHEAQRYTQPTSDIGQRGAAIRTACEVPTVRFMTPTTAFTSYA